MDAKACQHVPRDGSLLDEMSHAATDTKQNNTGKVEKQDEYLLPLAMEVSKMDDGVARAVLDGTESGRSLPDKL